VYVLDMYCIEILCVLWIVIPFLCVVRPFVFRHL